jgi:DNA-binding NarL/FixJ family response regulator
MDDMHSAHRQPNKPVRVLIADDQWRARQALKALLSVSGPRVEIQIVGEAANGQEALRRVETDPPDLILMDAQMPVMDGVKATRRIKRGWPQVRIVVLTLYPSYRAAALQAGADAFLIKGCAVGDLMAAIENRPLPSSDEAPRAAPGAGQSGPK